MRSQLSDDERRAIAESLWHEHGASIYRFALRLSGNRTVAEDIASETILVVLESVGRKDPSTLHRGYLFGIALNRWRRLRRIPSESIEDLVAMDSPWRESMLDFERAFRQLSPPLQEAFVLCKAEGLTSKEAAEILGIPQGTVQARTHEAVHRLRQMMGTENPPSLLLREAQS